MSGYNSTLCRKSSVSQTERVAVLLHILQEVFHLQKSNSYLEVDRREKERCMPIINKTRLRSKAFRLGNILDLNKKTTNPLIPNPLPPVPNHFAFVPCPFALVPSLSFIIYPLFLSFITYYLPFAPCYP